MAVAMRPAGADGAEARRVFDAFVAGVDAGLFGSSRVVEQAVSVHAEDGALWTTLEARFSEISAWPFAALRNMVRASMPEASQLEIHEQDVDERIALVRSFEYDGEATILDIRWRISLNASDAPGIAVRFGAAPLPEMIARTIHLLHVWRQVIALGAFPPPDQPAAAVLLVVGDRGPAEVFARFERLACAHDGYEALFEALNAIHLEVPIAEVILSHRAPEDAGAPTGQGERGDRPDEPGGKDQ